MVKRHSQKISTVVITDMILKGHFDEGAKIATINILKRLKEKYGFSIVSINGRRTFNFIDDQFRLNKLLFGLQFYKKIKKYGGKILYIPGSSITLASFVRARLLQMFTGMKVSILSLQPVMYHKIIEAMIKIIRPSYVITQSSSSVLFLKRMGIDARMLPLGVDDIKFNTVDRRMKALLRNKYSIFSDVPVVLHVGHIRTSRNLEWLIKIKQCLPQIEVIIVGSTSTPQGESLYELLIQNGITVVRDYLNNVEELYNIADYYLFPVIRNDAAIDTPLSVLEAMACNIPIITTAFGSLPDQFSEDDNFYFVNSIDEAIGILKNSRIRECKNRDKVKQFTWDEVVRKLVEMVE